MWPCCAPGRIWCFLELIFFRWQKNFTSATAWIMGLANLVRMLTAVVEEGKFGAALVYWL